jgi:hypothetical protein
VGIAESIESTSTTVAPRRNAGRLVGGMLFLHLAIGLTAPFILLDPLIARQGFLPRAAEFSTQIRSAVFLLFVGSALTMGVTSAGWRVFRNHSAAMSLWLFGLAVASFSLQAVDNAHILSMLSLSQRYADAHGATAELFEGLAIVTGAARKWSHYSALLTVGCWIVLFFAVLFRYRLTPRWLSAAGIVGALMQIGGVTVRALLDLSPETRLAMPLAPIYVLTAIWLMVRGFQEPAARSVDERLP